MNDNYTGGEDFIGNTSLIKKNKKKSKENYITTLERSTCNEPTISNNNKRGNPNELNLGDSFLEFELDLITFV